MTDQVPQNPEDEDHTLSTKLRYVALNNFEQPILDFANAALESGRLIVKRAAVAAADSAGLILDDGCETYTATIGKKRICMIVGVDEDDALVVLSHALIERRIEIVDVDDFNLREPTSEEKKKWEQATKTPPHEPSPWYDPDEQSCTIRRPPYWLFLTNSFDPSPPAIAAINEPPPAPVR